jgi:hypothetical protein
VREMDDLIERICFSKSLFCCLDDDSDWKPPTPEEMKAIEERRARMDIVSREIGMKLLQGWALYAQKLNFLAPLDFTTRSIFKNSLKNASFLSNISHSLL